MNPSKTPVLNLIVTGSVMSNSGTPGTVACWLFCPWDSPGQNTGVGSHSLLRGIFRTQRLKRGLLHCRQILYHLNHQGSHLSYMLKSSESESCSLMSNSLLPSVEFSRPESWSAWSVNKYYCQASSVLYSIIPQVTVTPSKILMSLIHKQLGNSIFKKFPRLFKYEARCKEPLAS